MIRIQITETLQRIVEVETDDVDKALSEVSDNYNNEDIVLDADDFNGTEIEVIE